MFAKKPIVALVGLVLCFPAMSYAADNMINKSTGLYTYNLDFQLVQNLSFGANVLYYFGDADNFSSADKNKASISGEDIGVSVNVAYHQPISKHFSMRYTGTLGTLRGNNKDTWSKIPSRGLAYRRFNSVFFQPAVGVECFPINRYGFFLYAGIAGTVSYIVNSDYRSENGEPVPGKRSTIVFLPMAQVSLGYTWTLSSSWMIGIHALFEIGFVPESRGINLDGWPINSGSKADKSPDGWFGLGISGAYML